jgi:hypothetical protein
MPHFLVPIIPVKKNSNRASVLKNNELKAIIFRVWIGILLRELDFCHKLSFVKRYKRPHDVHPLLFLAE